MYKYKVYYWDKIDDESNTEEGLIGEKSYESAIHELSEYYGEENILNLEVEVVENPLVEENIRHIFMGE